MELQQLGIWKKKTMITTTRNMTTIPTHFNNCSTTTDPNLDSSSEEIGFSKLNTIPSHVSESS